MIAYIEGRIGHICEGAVPQNEISFLAGKLLNGLAGIYALLGLARNAYGALPTHGNDILMATLEGYIIADASGYVGFVADRKAQRDREAIIPKDSTGVAGGSDEN